MLIYYASHQNQSKDVLSVPGFLFSHHPTQLPQLRVPTVAQFQRRHVRLALLKQMSHQHNGIVNMTAGRTDAVWNWVMPPVAGETGWLSVRQLLTLINSTAPKINYEIRSDYATRLIRLISPNVVTPRWDDTMLHSNVVCVCVLGRGQTPATITSTCRLIESLFPTLGRTVGRTHILGNRNRKRHPLRPPPPGRT